MHRARSDIRTRARVRLRHEYEYEYDYEYEYEYEYDIVESDTEISSDDKITSWRWRIVTIMSNEYQLSLTDPRDGIVLSTELDDHL